MKVKIAAPKNCPSCGSFMNFYMCSGARNDLFPQQSGDDPFTVFFECPNRGCRTVEMIDGRHYAWLYYGGSIDLEIAQSELPEDEFLALKNELAEMKGLFDQRPYRSIPKPI